MDQNLLQWRKICIIHLLELQDDAEKGVKCKINITKMRMTNLSGSDLRYRNILEVCTYGDDFVDWLENVENIFRFRDMLE